MRDAEGWDYRPIDTWPGEETPDRRGAPFSAGWGTTLDLLRRELRMLGTAEWVWRRRRARGLVEPRPSEYPMSHVTRLPK